MCPESSDIRSIFDVINVPNETYVRKINDVDHQCRFKKGPYFCYFLMPRVSIIKGRCACAFCVVCEIKKEREGSPLGLLGAPAVR